MKTKISIPLSVLLLGVAFLCLAPTAGRAQSVEDLRVEYLKNPVGIDVEQPRFSWKIKAAADELGVLQTQYTITVATDAEFLNTVWNSGEISSDRSVHIPYGGNALAAATRYYWKVDVSDNLGHEITSAEEAFFETGLMNAAGWGNAQWIKATTDPKPADADKKIGFAIEMKFKISAGAAGIVFSLDNATKFLMWQTSISGDKLTFIPYSTVNANAWTNPLGNNNFLTVENGDTSTDAVHTIRIEVKNNLATTTIDGYEIDKDRAHPFGGNYLTGYDQLGFREWSTESALFDDIIVTDLYEKGSPVVTYEADFSDGINPYNANSSLEDGWLRVAGPGGSGTKYALIRPEVEVTADRLAKERAPYTRYSVEMDFQIDNIAASPVFGATGTGDFFMWQINIATSGQILLRPHVWTAGRATLVAGIDITDRIENFLANKNAIHHLKIDVDGAEASTYIDDVLVDEKRKNPRNDETNYGYGGLGVGFRADKASATNPERTYYDNVVVTIKGDGEEVEDKVILSEDFSNPDNYSFTTVEGSSVVDGRFYIVGPSGNTHYLFWQQARKPDDTPATPAHSGGIPLFRTEFSLDDSKTIASARLYTSGLGVYDLFLNGQRVGTPDNNGDLLYDELKPGWTDYSKTVFYSTFDVKDQLQNQANVLGASVASGWWNGVIAHKQYGEAPASGFIAKLVVNYTDHTTDVIVTDPAGWFCSTGGPLRSADIYNGESYDARLESNWSSPGFDDSDWYQCAAQGAATSLLKASVGPPVRVRPELQRTPVKITTYKEITATGTTYGSITPLNTYPSPTPVTLDAATTALYDLGQNMTGWVKFKVKGEAGTRITVRFAEMLNDDGSAGRRNDGPGGSLYRAALRTAQATLTYTLKGDPEGETFQPSATFFGFRYCDVTTTADVEIESLTGEVVGTVAEETATFITSHDAVNQLYSNILWGQRSNFLSIPTDCPQRDERLGWTGDVQIFGRTATYNADVAAFFRKWMGDMRDGQHGSSGAFPAVAPANQLNDYKWGPAAWADAGVVIPWTTYLMYADRGILEENYSALMKYFNYVKNDFTNNDGSRNKYGDWLAPSGNRLERYVSDCYDAYVALLMEKIARALSSQADDGYAADATEARTFYEQVKAAFPNKYFDGNGLLTTETQTGYLLALKFDLLTDRAKGIERLKQIIADNGNKLSTGFVGTGVLNQTLSEAGLTDVAYNLLLQRDYPSWLYSVDQGATTLWERWNSYTVASGFGDVDMNSFNHYAYGVIGEWMYRYMGGIDADESNPGFKHILLNPSPDFRATRPEGQDRITSAAATYNSYYGTISSAWTIDSDNDKETVNYNLTIPANTTATLTLTLNSAKDAVLDQDGKPVAAQGSNNGIVSIDAENGKAVLELQSGTYSFKTQNMGPYTDMQSLKPGDFTIYPNPVNKVLNISPGENIVAIRLFNSLGKTIYTQSGGAPVEMSALPSGIYFVQIDNGENSQTVKVIKH
jgi:alpha-L-rhamnosidase